MKDFEFKKLVYRMREAAEILSTTEETLRKYADEGKLQLYCPNGPGTKPQYVTAPSIRHFVAKHSDPMWEGSAVTEVQIVTHRRRKIRSSGV